MKQMAKRLAVPSKETQLHIVGARDVFKASRVQRLSLGTDIPSTTVDELGNSLHVGDVKDTPNVTLSFSAFDTSIKIFSAMTGTNPAAFPVSGVDIVELGELDAILFTKDATLSDYVKSGHARKLQIRDFSFSYTVDGEATEDYTAIGSERRWLKNDVIVDKFVSSTTSFTLTQTPLQLKNGNWLLSVILDGEYLTEVSATPGTGEYSVASKTLTTGDTRTAQVLAVYHAIPAGSNWSDIADDTIPAAIKGKDVGIQILANDIPRVQSVTLNGNLNSQPVKELGNRNISGYQRQIPTIDGTITVLDTDTELISLLTVGTLSGVDVEWQPGEGCATEEISLKVELMDPCDTTAPYTVLKTIYLPSITIVGDSYTQNVNNNAQQVFNFKSADAQCIVHSGAMV
jgi:hypothetical protein